MTALNKSGTEAESYKDTGNFYQININSPDWELTSSERECTLTKAAIKKGKIKWNKKSVTKKTIMEEML